MNELDDSHSRYASSDPIKLLQPSLLLIEDDPQMGGILMELLEDDYRAHWVTTGKAAIHEFGMNPYDAVIVDRRLPDMDGLDFVRSARREGITVPMLMLTALSSTEEIVSGLDAGANDYLSKPFRFEELNARIRSLLRGYQAQQQSHAIGDWTFKEHRGLIESPSGISIQLSPAEASLLKALCINPDRVFTRKELLMAAFSRDAGEGTIDTYVSYIRQKTVKGLIMTVRGKGYCLGNPMESDPI